MSVLPQNTCEASTQSVRVSEIRDPAVLFELYSTEEMRKIERSVRSEIEQKKGELRDMVRERYRDLVDAANTVGEMRQCSESVVRSIQDIHKYCHSLKQQGRTNDCQWTEENTGLKQQGRTNDRQRTEENTCQEEFYTMASQIKLLLEIPMHIRSAMESSQYLQATELYMLYCHLCSQLRLETDSTGRNDSSILVRFPILNQQVSNMGHFRSDILTESKLALGGRAIPDHAIAEALVSTMLLEDTSARQVLSDFLLARKASFHLLLSQPGHVTGIKAQVCSLVELYVNTLFQAYTIFYHPPEGEPVEGAVSRGMLFSMMEDVTTTTPHKKGWMPFQDMSMVKLLKYLPSSIITFQPTQRNLAQPIQREELRDMLQHWIDTCKEDLRGGISSLLAQVDNLKGLASIRDAAWDLSSEAISRHCGTVYHQLLEGPLATWQCFLQPLFLDRLQAITREETQAISLNFTEHLSSALRNLEAQSAQSPAPLPSGNPDPSSTLREGKYEADEASFLWSGHLFRDAAWESTGQQGQQQQYGGLTTSSVQSLCSSLDARLETTLDELQCYLLSQDKASSTTSTPVSNSGASQGPTMFPVNVKDNLRQNCLACMRHILSSIRCKLVPGPMGPSHLSTVLFLARLCQSIGELCPNLRQCILWEMSGSNTLGLSSEQPGKGAALTSAQAEWEALNQELIGCSMEAYSVWTNGISKVLVGSFATALHSESRGSILTTATNWEEHEIHEEGECSGSKTFKIRLPVQPSWFVQSMLFQLCVEVSRVGGHVLPGHALNLLLQACLDGTLQHYHGLTQQGQRKEGFLMTQNGALQLLFDLRSLTTILKTRPEEGQSCVSEPDPRIQQVCDWLESYIDHCDLDVLTQPLNANIKHFLQRTSVLLGLLTGTESHLVSHSSSPQEQHNVLPLDSSQIRFALLPLGVSQNHPQNTKY